ncbi:fimbria/pilus outer membrane usher protein [Providencia manganoxydans]|uniref:fimbria/pilus outer membrane usher protein n=1 Tax=Providencia manganoxydans TaxID=2923283 RepID=UPI0032DAD2B6
MKKILVTRKSKVLFLHKKSIVALLVSMTFSSFAEDYFDPNLLSFPNGSDRDNIDLSIFSKSGAISPGHYLVTVYINQQESGVKEINFIENNDGKVYPELTKENLDELGVNTQIIKGLSSLKGNEIVSDINEFIPDFSDRFDLAKLSLYLSIPQIDMKHQVGGYIDPNLFSEGVPAAIFNYQFSGGKNWQDGNRYSKKSSSDNFYATANGGINLGAWRLRSTATYTRNTFDRADSKTTDSKTKFSNSYVMREIRKWRSELFIGETNTGSEIFDSIPFKGIKINSNEQMLPSSLRGFAPEINGIAQSNARISISQNGTIIYQTYVAPGPFSIRDLYPTNMGGDLVITITEEDGTIKTFNQPYSALPVMVRSGQMKYEISSGQYNGEITNGSRKSNFILGTLIYGLPKNLTLYGGTLLAEKYMSGTLGTGFSIGVFGAFSADITVSSAKFNHQDTKTGQSYRVRYSKSLLSTGTSVDLTALRYSTKDYYSFSDFNNTGYDINQGIMPWLSSRKKNSFQTSLSQSIGKYGSVSLMASRDDFWDRNETVTNLSLSYNTNIKGVNVNTAYSISRTDDTNGKWPENKQLSLSIQVPFSLFSQSELAENIYSNYQLSHSNNGKVSQSVGLSGNALNNALSYSINQSWGNKDQDYGGSLNASYTGNKGNISSGYNYTESNRSVNLSGNGGVVIHKNGIILSPTLGSSIAIVEAQDAKGAKVENGNTVNSDGYAVSSYLSDYNKNIVSINPTTLPENTTLIDTSVNVYPTKGAVVKAQFKTNVGYQALLTVNYNGGFVPFGAIATIIDNNKEFSTSDSSIVGELGQLYLSGLQEKGIISVKWGNKEEQQCTASYQLPNNLPSDELIKQLSINCI